MTLYTVDKADSLELAVISRPEQQRLMHFLNTLVNWYKLNHEGEINTLMCRYLVTAEVRVILSLIVRVRLMKIMRRNISSVRRFESHSKRI